VKRSGNAIVLWLLWIVPSALAVVYAATKIRFAQPHVLWLLWLLPALAALYAVAARQREKALHRFADPALLARLVPPVSEGRSAVRGALVGLALTALILGAAGPQWGFQWEEVSRRGVDVVVALDLSRSMLAEDAKPTRLAAAKREIRDLIELLQGDRVGLVVFAGTAYTQCPLTLDYGAFEVFLDQLDPDWVPVGGTDLAGAVRQSIQTFAAGEHAGRALILITDGEDHGGELPAAAEEAKKEGVHVFVVGMGAPEGAPIPDGRGGFVQDGGKTVLTKLDEPALKELALATEGSYVRSVAGDIDLRKIYLEDIKSTLQARELSSSRQKRWEERFQWLLLPALLLLLAEALMGPPRRRDGPGLRTAALLLLLLLPTTAHAGWFGRDDPVRAGHAAFAEGNFEQALASWVQAQVDDPSDRRLDYNIAEAHYRLGQYPEAEKAFQAAAADRANPLAADALYGAGNAAFQQGRYPDAIAAFDAALELRPDDEDAQANRDLAQRTWEEAMKQAQEQPPEPPPEDQEQEQEDDQQQEQQQEQRKEQQQGGGASEQNEQQEPSQDRQDEEKDGEQEDQNKGDAEEPKEQEAQRAEAADIERNPEGEEPPSPSDGDGAISNQTEEAEAAPAREPVEGALPPEQAEALLKALKADQSRRRKERTEREAQGGRRAAGKDW
jgi:Ca-activated chloride channel family protein